MFCQKNGTMFFTSHSKAIQKRKLKAAKAKKNAVDKKRCH